MSLITAKKKKKRIVKEEVSLEFPEKKVKLIFRKKKRCKFASYHFTNNVVYDFLIKP